MTKKYTVIANWKMYLGPTEARNFFNQNSNQFVKLTTSKTEIVLCPGFTEIIEMAASLKNSKVFVGAQDCSDACCGPYTGQIAASSLSEIGCKYCIVGHSERRACNSETPEMVAQKTLRVLENNMSPIICIGEDFDEYKSGRVFETLSSQLRPVFEGFELELPINHIYIAYEPVWSIGTNEIAPNSYLESVFTWLADLFALRLPSCKVNFLYGGSANSKNVKNLLKIKKIEGFLLGRASLDFPEFEKIVECCNNE